MPNNDDDCDRKKATYEGLNSEHSMHNFEKRTLPTHSGKVVSICMYVIILMSVNAFCSEYMYLIFLYVRVCMYLIHLY